MWAVLQDIGDLIQLLGVAERVVRATLYQALALRLKYGKEAAIGREPDSIPPNIGFVGTQPAAAVSSSQASKARTAQSGYSRPGRPAWCASQQARTATGSKKP